MDACKVLDELDFGQGFDPGENKTARNECVTSKLDYGGLGLVLDPRQGLSEFSKENSNATNETVNGRRALQASESDGSCMVAVEVAEHARAMVTVSPHGVGKDGCPEAKRWARALEPKLPKAQ